jgi:glycosyltransferase involved in cell wall biosynthesis
MPLEKPLVSVIVPTYRRADRICRAIDSIAAQTYDVERIEVLVVNDNRPEWPECSETDAKLGRYERLPHFRILHTSGANGGGAARNLACRQAAGTYVAFLDDDDEFLPEKIEKQVSFMETGGLDMSWQDVSWYDESGRLVEHRRLDHCEDFSQEGLLRAHLLTPIAPTSIYMLTRELFQRTEGFGEVKTGQDWWLMLRCIEAGARIGYMPEVHVRQYLHDGERLSLGQNKIDGENARYEAASRYFDRLSREDIRYITFRHFAVLAFACKRSGRMADAAKYAFRTIFATSPAASLRAGVDFFTKGKRA